jgi:hypothetical protein
MSYVEEIAGKKWESYDGMASEMELGDFMYGLIRELKPRIVLETGCYLGHTSIPMAKALHENKLGVLHTCDTDPKLCDLLRIDTMDLPMEVHNCTGLELACKIDGVGVAFLDSSGDRVQEACALKMHPDGVVVLHDAHRPSFTEIVRAKGWRYFKLPTPRGLGLFQME